MTNVDIMRILAVAINKGGPGKTTTAKSLATAATAAGFNVLLLDMDSQENSRKWGDRRKKRNPYKILPMVKFTTENSLPEELEKAQRAGCELVIIDTPPGRSTEAVAAVEAADLVLIPIEADDQDSFDGIPKTARLARSSEDAWPERPLPGGYTPAFVLLNKATPNARGQIETARLVCDAAKVPMAPVVMHRYIQHRDANPKGLTAQELEPGSIPASEVGALWNWVCAQLQMGNTAHTQDGTTDHVHIQTSAGG
jgi:chromosome partitioning protein